MDGNSSIDEMVEYFRSKGYSETAFVASGMEGAVLELVPQELVAKVWWGRSRPEVETLAAFYTDIAGKLGGIASPRIIDVQSAGEDVPISFERFLPGQPLVNWVPEDSRRPDPRAVSATLEVLSAMRGIAGGDGLRRLAVLGEQEPLWRGPDDSWSSCMSRLVSRRLARYGRQLQTDVPDLDELVEAVRAFLRRRDAVALTLVHGDLCGVNILVDEGLRPSAVIDFGFLSSSGDPAFDASVTSAIFNMYGKYARLIDEQVTRELCAELGYELDTILAYRAVYALITSNAYSEDGLDGHYRWCVAMLKREDVREGLGL